MRALDTVPRPVRLLDVGGTQQYWEQMGFSATGVEITVLNQSAVPDLGGLKQVTGDARHMPEYSDNAFDVVFSNSVIEHVGGWDDQQAMAREVQRIGKRYFVQTPNRWFPIEPHFVVPGFQFLPVTMRALLLQHFTLGHMKRTGSYRTAERTVRSIRLLDGREVRSLFPGAQLYRERMLGLTKSFMAVGGWG